MRHALAVLALTAFLPAQNLLRWTDWTTWNEQHIVQFSKSPTAIRFAPFSPVPGPVCGIEQWIDVPRAGLYQLRFDGVGGQTGFFYATWEIQTHSIPWQSFYQQTTWTLWLAAGPSKLRLVSNTSNLWDPWGFKPPELWSVVAPTVDVQFAKVHPTADFKTSGEILMFGFQQQRPVTIPGFQHGYELIGPVLVHPGPTLSCYLWTGLSWPEFYVQAVTLSGSPALGSALRVDPWIF